MGEPLNPTLRSYLSNLGLGSMNLTSFVCNFKLQESSFLDFIRFVVSEENSQEIASYYSQIIYSTISDRKLSGNDNYDYGEGRFTKRFK